MFRKETFVPNETFDSNIRTQCYYSNKIKEIQMCGLSNMHLRNEKYIQKFIYVYVALGYVVDDRVSRIRLPAGAENFSFHQRVKKGSGAHPASYSTGIRGSFLAIKRPGREADHSSPSSAEVKK
jgi:hypothetical protein